ncbi:hypothetical protein [Pseudomonas sp. R5(2019)]|uniref:hypothetical protein n=1 Tax=Pseudomonas sp. R5(2019) TaxID=2697566 RepID=UPI00141280E6|nr:hypothetical protein [Pseudomonas sp. R5(2019)]NBA96603.1 hypothetical protein [Pseudomonas sp. R5(2019)]
MSTDSSFEDQSASSKPGQAAEDAEKKLDKSIKSDPLARPDVVTREKPHSGRDPATGDGIPDDEDMPLPND